MNNRVYLAQLSPVLRPALDESTLKYRQLYNMVLDGLLPLKRDMSGRYYADPQDMPEITEIVRTAVNSRLRTAA